MDAGLVIVNRISTSMLTSLKNPSTVIFFCHRRYPAELLVATGHGCELLVVALRSLSRLGVTGIVVCPDTRRRSALLSSVTS
jgi:hypothetical protein